MRASLEAITDGTITKDKTMDEYYLQILSESKSLERLVANLLELSRLQDPNLQSNSKTNTGLDSAVIAHEIAKRHGLDIRAESTVKKGSLFIIETA